MDTSKEIYEQLSAAVRELRTAARAAKRRVLAAEKLPTYQRDCGRIEYIRVLEELQEKAQAILDCTDGRLREQAD